MAKFLLLFMCWLLLIVAAGMWLVHTLASHIIGI